MRKSLLLTATFAFVSSFLITETSVFARHLNYGWPSKTVPLKAYNYNSNWQTPMNNSVLSWNNSSANVSFQRGSICNNSITAAQYSYSSYGINRSTYVLSNLLRFQIELNSRTIARDATNFSNFVRSVFVHELGHSIWLKDNPNTSSASIMHYSRNRNSMISPQSYDISSVNAKYK